MINCTAVQLMILPKQNGEKQNSGKLLRVLNTKDIAPEKLKGLTTKATNFSLKREYYVDIENCRRKELDKAIEKFYVEVCNFVMPIINK